jgi:hypothetical protein
MLLEQKAELIGKFVQEWLISNNKLEVKPDDVMQHLKEHGLYNMNRKSASHLRRDLRKLADRNQLDLIKGLVFEQKNKNRLWFFKRVV